MKFGTRWQRATSIAAVWAWKDKVYRDKDKKFTIEDLDETAYAALYLGMVWSPQIALVIPTAAAASGPLAVVESAFIVGAFASFAIGGLEGVETYVDFFDYDMLTDPKKASAIEQATDITLSIVNPLHIPTKKLIEYGMENLPWNEIFRNRWANPTNPF